MQQRQVVLEVVSIRNQSTGNGVGAVKGLELVRIEALDPEQGQTEAEEQQHERGRHPAEDPRLSWLGLDLHAPMNRITARQWNAPMTPMVAT